MKKAEEYLIEHGFDKNYLGWIDFESISSIIKQAQLETIDNIRSEINFKKFLAIPDNSKSIELISIKAIDEIFNKVKGKL